jgi:hypothetical protein
MDQKRINVTMEVGDLSGDTKMVIGLDLFKPLGYQLQNIPILYPTENDMKKTKKKKKNNKYQNNDTSLEELSKYGIGSDGIAEEWRKVLADNAALPISSTCLIPESELSINTGDHKSVWIRQYPIPQALQERVKEWKENGWISKAPENCQWNVPLLAVPKPSNDPNIPDDIRVCLDGRPINAVIQDTPDSNLPGIREIIDRLGPNN